MEIKVLGSGCAKCKTTYEMIEKIVKENQLDATLSKVEDIVELLNYGIMNNPCHRRRRRSQTQRSRSHGERNQKDSRYLITFSS